MATIDTQLESLDRSVRVHAQAALRSTRRASVARRLGWFDEARAHMAAARREYYLADRARWEAGATASGFALEGVSP